MLTYEPLSEKHRIIKQFKQSASSAIKKKEFDLYLQDNRGKKNSCAAKEHERIHFSQNNGYRSFRMVTAIGRTASFYFDPISRGNHMITSPLVSDQKFRQINIPIKKHGVVKICVVIAADCWIAANSIAAGVPAKIIKQRKR